MFLDINGNTFSTLGNSNQVPAFDLNPRQIFGNDLFLWIDFSDPRTLFTDTGLTTNVTAYGDYIRGIRDKSQNNTSLRLANPQSGSTNYQYTSLTQFNNKGGIIRTAAQATTYNGGFVHSVNFLPSNTDYTFHCVIRPQASTGNAGIYVKSSFAGFFLVSNNINIATASNVQTTIFTLTNLVDLQILSTTYDFTNDNFEKYTNNIYGPVTTSANMSYPGGSPLNILTRFGSSPAFVSIAQNAFCQEMIFASGKSTTQQLNFIHQYLRLKYL